LCMKRAFGAGCTSHGQGKAYRQRRPTGGNSRCEREHPVLLLFGHRQMQRNDGVPGFRTIGTAVSTFQMGRPVTATAKDPKPIRQSGKECKDFQIMIGKFTPTSAMQHNPRARPVYKRSRVLQPSGPCYRRSGIGLSASRPTIVSCAAARRATGTRNDEQET
jgi:hypothetical protein